jgi:hypothetical protein
VENSDMAIVLTTRDEVQRRWGALRDSARQRIAPTTAP